jgi:WD40 repeat protein
MFRRFVVTGAAVVAVAAAATWFGELSPASAQAPKGDTPRVADPIVINDCKLNVVDREDVPAQRNGVLDFIGTEVKPDEMVPRHIRTWTVHLGEKPVLIRELKEGDEVREGDLLGRLDARLAMAEYDIKKSKVTQAVADASASEKLTEEGNQRYQTALKLKRTGNAISEEDVRGAWVTWQKYYQETIAKKEAIATAQAELKQAMVVLEMHEIRSKINGRIKTKYKRKGEAVKELEPVFQVYNYEKLRVEGLIETQFLPRLEKNMKVVVEASQTEGPELTLRGHAQEITGVAVSNDKSKPLIVSASEDGTVRVWSRGNPNELRILPHPMAVRAVACNPPGAPGHLCLTGCADGIGRIYDLNELSGAPRIELKGEHAKAINCVAFSLDGKLCATGGEDRNICIWDVAGGAVQHRISGGHGHRAGITTLQFFPDNRLMSAGRDNKLLLWQIAANGPQLIRSIADRSGEVPRLWASLDGERVLVDAKQNRELWIYSVPKQAIVGSLSNPLTSGGGAFTTMAMFSPDGKLALTASSGDNRLQLWRLPTPETRAYELRQFVTTERMQPSCGAFAPDGSFLVTGTKDRHVFVWEMPKKDEIEHLLTAVVTYIEPAVESTQRQVRIWAEMDNPNYKQSRLIPGMSVTMVAYPQR